VAEVWLPSLLLVTTAASARAIAIPRRRMPPRAVSRMAASLRASRITMRAPAGPE